MNANQTERTQERTLEIMLVLVTAGISSLLYHTGAMKVVVLNLFYLPIVLAGFFLGRYRAGVLALLAVVTATIVICMDFQGFATMNSPVGICSRTDGPARRNALRRPRRPPPRSP
jgi:uncharacterized membrane protein